MILQVESASQKETEQIIAERFNLPVTPLQKETLHRDASVTLTMTFSAEHIEMLEQVRGLVSHCLEAQDWSEMFIYIAKKELARRTKVRPKTAKKDLRDNVPANAIKDLNDNALATTNKRRPLSAEVRKTLLNTNARCQYKNHRGEQCKSSGSVALTKLDKS